VILHHEPWRSAGIRVIQIARDDVRVKVRQAVTERQDVQLRGSVVGLDRSTDCDEFPREGQQLVWT